MNKKEFQRELQILAKTGNAKNIQAMFRLARANPNFSSDVLSILQEKISDGSDSFLSEPDAYYTVALLGVEFPELRARAFETVGTCQCDDVFPSMLVWLPAHPDMASNIAGMMEKAASPSSIRALQEWLDKTYSGWETSLWEADKVEPAFAALARMLPDMDEDQIYLTLQSMFHATLKREEFFDRMRDVLMDKRIASSSISWARLANIVQAWPAKANETIDALAQRATTDASFTIRDIAEAVPHSRPYAIEVLKKSGTYAAAVAMGTIATDFPAHAEKALSGLVELKDVFNDKAVSVGRMIGQVLERALTAKVLTTLIGERDEDENEKLKNAFLEAARLVPLDEKFVTGIFAAATEIADLNARQAEATHSLWTLHESAFGAKPEAPAVG